MIHLPLITIIIPSYNQANYLEQTLCSIINQDYPATELFVIDGGSTDDSVSVIHKYESHLKYWVSEKDSGQSEAINKGIRKASGEIITWLNSDDYYEPGTLNKIAKCFSDNSVHAICGDCRFFFEGEPSKNYINKHGAISFDRTIQYWKTNPAAIPPQPAIFIRSSVWQKTGLLNERLRYGMDYEFWLRVLKHFEIKYVPELFAHYRFHQNSKSFADNGFEKFHPEWHLVFMEALKNENIFTQWKHQLEYGLFYYDWKYNKKQLMLQYLFNGFIRKSKYNS